jgi:hypothetical protein
MNSLQREFLFALLSETFHFLSAKVDWIWAEWVSGRQTAIGERVR